MRPAGATVVGSLEIHASPGPGETFGVCAGDPLRTGWSVEATFVPARSGVVGAVYVDASGTARVVRRAEPVAAGNPVALRLSGPLEAPAGVTQAADGSFGVESLVLVFAESDLDPAIRALLAGTSSELRLATHGVPVVGQRAGSVEVTADEDGVAVVPFWWGLVVGGSLAGALPQPEDSVLIRNVIGMPE